MKGSKNESSRLRKHGPGRIATGCPDMVVRQPTRTSGWLPESGYLDRGWAICCGAERVVRARKRILQIKKQLFFLLCLFVCFFFFFSPCRIFPPAGSGGRSGAERGGARRACVAVGRPLLVRPGPLVIAGAAFPSPLWCGARSRRAGPPVPKNAYTIQQPVWGFGFGLYGTSGSSAAEHFLWPKFLSCSVYAPGRTRPKFDPTEAPQSHSST